MSMENKHYLTLRIANLRFHEPLAKRVSPELQTWLQSHETDIGGLVGSLEGLLDRQHFGTSVLVS